MFNYHKVPLLNWQRIPGEVRSLLSYIARFLRNLIVKKRRSANYFNCAV